jgi:hypothetical protein
MSQLDATLRELRESWRAVNRYRVIRIEPGAPDQVLAGPLTWEEADAKRDSENALIAAAPGYRLVMSRPLVHVERLGAPVPDRVCACGCARSVSGRAVLAMAACRKRMQRRRERGQ